MRKKKASSLTVGIVLAFVSASIGFYYVAGLILKSGWSSQNTTRDFPPLIPHDLDQTHIGMTRDTDVTNRYHRL
jgi:hypothetical protein